MDPAGLRRAARYAFPPNSLMLCGPTNQTDLQFYASSQHPDTKTADILAGFSTLYPYLCLIAGENHIKDPFDTNVVEAYWVGNGFLRAVSKSALFRHMTETFGLRKKQKTSDNDLLGQKIFSGGVPHHAFHVLNIYTRTGHMNTAHTTETMDACIVNYGRVLGISDYTVTVLTRPLRRIGDEIGFGKPMKRIIRSQGIDDTEYSSLKTGDWITYHWGYLCERINDSQKHNLWLQTTRAIRFANQRMND